MVTVENRQYKGIGRTAQAASHLDGADHDGLLDAHHAAAEILNGFFALHLIGVRAISPTHLFLLSREAYNLKCDAFVAVREASPLRLGHLQMMTGIMLRYTSHRSMAMWRRMINHLYDRDSYDLSETEAEQCFDDVMRSAFRALVENRFFGLSSTNWSDNADVFGRDFDFEDMQIVFPNIVGSADYRLPDRRTAPLEFFGKYDFVRLDERDSYWSTLRYVRNGLESVELIARGIGYSIKSALGRYPWRKLDQLYRREIASFVERLETRTPAVSSVSVRLAEAFPLAEHLDRASSAAILSEVMPASITAALKSHIELRSSIHSVLEHPAVKNEDNEIRKVARYRRLFRDYSNRIEASLGIPHGTQTRKRPSSLSSWRR